MTTALRFLAGMIFTGSAVAAGVLILSLFGCSTPDPLRPGKATLTKPSAAAPASVLTVTQPENPAMPTSQTTETADETAFIVPAGALVTQTETAFSEGKTNVLAMAFTTPEPMPVRRTRSEKTDQQVGAAQKDMGREIAAKLASMKSVQFVGVVMILSAVAMFHPVVARLVASRTVQVVTGITGFALLVLPLVIVGNEKWILLGAVVPVGWWIIHRNASKSTEVRVLREWMDEDGDGKHDKTGQSKADFDKASP